LTFTAVPPTDKYRVIHIDDEQEQLFFAKTFLEEADPAIEVISVMNADELLEALDERIDCIVSDYVMPEMDGMEVCRLVKEKSNVPYVIYTGRGSEVVAEAAFNSGVDDYVRKEPDPSHYQLLARRIKSHADTYRRNKDSFRYQERLEGVRSNLHLISSANTMESVAVTTHAILKEVLGYQDGCFTLVNEGKPRVIHNKNSPQPDQMLLSEVLTEGAIKQFNDEDSWCLYVPLKMEQTHGVVSIYQNEPFNKQDYPILDALSLLVGQAIIRVRQLETISASEQQFRSIVENVQDVVMLTNPEGTIKYISPSTKDALEYPAENLTGKMWGDLVHEEDIEIIGEFYRGSMDGVKGQIKEYRVVSSRGETRWVSHSWTPIIVDGEVRLVVSALNDITWRKKIESTLYTSLEELEKVNSDLNDFTHIVSHDLKTPLMTIESFSSFLLEDYLEDLDETGQEYLEAVINASNSMRDLIDNLLTLSRVGRSDTDYSKVDLKEIFDEVLLDLAPQIEMKHAIIKAEDLPEIVTQRTWMKQVMQNLIGNGLKFNEAHPPRVDITCVKDDDYYTFNVRDNGIGIPENEQEHLFGLFQRLHHAQKYPGTGAGLSICKKIVENMGGSISVESEEGYGSTFIFSIPRDVVPDVKIANSIQVETR
jgi:PAS domain S-box-containing protein